MCHIYKVLPQAGGLLDQDSLLVYLLQVYESAVAERQSREHQQREREMQKARARSK